MARVFTPQDAYAVLTLLNKELTGQDAQVTTVDASNFVSVGETILSGNTTENILNSLSTIIGRTFMAVRPYKAKLSIINALNSGIYSNRMRKISLYSRNPEESGDWNTQLNTNFLTGYDNGTNGGHSTASMWEQNLPVALEMNFGGSTVWEESITVLENQLAEAFTSAENFSAFMNGVMTEKANDIETSKESFNRMVLLNHLAGVYDMSADMPESVIDLTAGFNTEYGTSLTREEILSDHLTEFLQYMTATMQTVSDRLENRSALYHWTPTKAGYSLLRHTRKDRQKVLIYEPLMNKFKARVFSELFNPEYLKQENYEGVDFWQNINEPSKVDFTPAIPDKTTGAQKAGANVKLDYVVGMIYDEDALLTDFQFESTNTTPLEARKRYRNIFWHFKKNAINDFTENTVLFVML